MNNDYTPLGRGVRRVIESVLLIFEVPSNNAHCPFVDRAHLNCGLIS
jgi:hypothetical protein